MARDFAKSFYKSAAWQRCRDGFIAYRRSIDGGVCQRCHDMPGYIVHHKIYLSPANLRDPQIALSFDNLELLCRECHAEAHDLQGGRWAKVTEKKRRARADAQRYFIGENGKIFSKDPPSVAENSPKL